MIKNRVHEDLNHVSIINGIGWAGLAIAHLDFVGIEKRIETQMDNPLLFAHSEFSCFRHL